MQILQAGTSEKIGPVGSPKFCRALDLCDEIHLALDVPGFENIIMDNYKVSKKFGKIIIAQKLYF